MRPLLITLLLAAAASASPAASLEIEVSGLRSTEGMVLLAVYDQAEAWMKKPLRAAAAQPGANGKSVIRLDNLPDGDYAISVIHDANGNRKLDSNVMGMPTEAYGFSNNASGNFGPPSFEAARFSVRGDALQRIQLN